MRAYVGFRLGDSGAGKGHTAWTRRSLDFYTTGRSRKETTSTSTRTMCDEQELIATDGLRREIRRREIRHREIRHRENDEPQSCGHRNGGIRSRGSSDGHQR
jgi:hypothetical protein